MIGTFKTIWDFAGKERSNIRKSLIVSFVYSLFNALTIVALYLVLAGLVTNTVTTGLALEVLAIMVASVAGRIATRYFSQLQQTHASYFMIADKRLSIGQKLISVPMGYFSDTSVGHITAIETTTLDDAENMAPIVLVTMLGGFIDTIAFMLMFLVFEWRIGLVATAGAAIFLLLTAAMEGKAHRDIPQRQAAQADLVDAMLERIQGMSVVKAFNIKQTGQGKVERAIQESFMRNRNLEFTMTPLLALQQLTLSMTSVIMMAASIALYLQGAMTLVNCLLCIVVSFVIFSQLRTAGSAMSGLRIVEASLKRVEEIDRVPTMEEGETVDAPETHQIEFDHVSFSYGKRPVLQDVSAVIPDKKLTAIVGPSGSGKTTMCNLVSRFWDVDEGAVKIGGTDVRAFELDALMESISTVFQDVYLFNDTVEDNIRFGNPNATFDQVKDAAQRACCSDFVERLPDGYQTMIGEGGAALSGGEKQRLSIARALLKDAPIVIFDEATANVDPENEDKLQSAIESLTRDRTVVMIAHRLKTVRNADQILVLDGGRIVQAGTHDELVDVPGIYRNFVKGRREAIGWKLGGR